MNYGPYIKSQNNNEKIIYNLLISLVPFVIYRIYLTNIESIISLFIIIIVSVLANIIFDTLKNLQNYKFRFKNYLYPIIIGTVIYLFIPYNTPLFLTVLATLVGIIINKLFKNINPVLITSLIIYAYFLITNNNIIKLDFNIFILIGISILSLGYLILNRSLKFRISLVFILLSLLSLLITEIDYNNIYLLIILGIYIIPELYSTPNTAMAGILYALMVSIMFIILPMPIFLIFGIIMNILNRYLDLNVAFYLVKNN